MKTIILLTRSRALLWNFYRTNSLGFRRSAVRVCQADIWVGDESPQDIVQELCESRGGRPGLSVLTSLLVSVDVKIYCTVLRHWSQLVPNMSHDI